MAGYILKIVIEDTHPPVWRRILIPERITFEELHRIIQIVFGWTDEHLHDFRIPSEDICIDDGEEVWSDYHYMENETLVEQFLLQYQWMRYTYDFGDEWRHKIIYEKTDESYEERYASLLKVKGDNFLEDSGGVWESEESGSNRYAFDRSKVEEQLKNLVFPMHDELNETMSEVLSEADMEKMAEEFLTTFINSFKSRFGNDFDKVQKSKMAVKIDKWKQFSDDSFQKKTTKDNDYSQMVLPFLKEEDMDDPDYVLEIVPGVKSCAELLNDLNLRETEDYCKYLQIPVQDAWSKKQMADAIAQEFSRHPEYLLYVLGENEYKEFLSWMELPYGRGEIPWQDNMLIKAVGLGLVEIVLVKNRGKTRAKLSFAKDAHSIVNSLPADVRKRTYRELKRFSKKLEDIILVYGMVDFDSLYEMFEKIYHETMKQEELCRYVYWFARFNNLVQTAYLLDGSRYVASVQLDVMSVLEKMQNYSNDLDYVLFPEKELHKMAYDLGESSEWFDILFTTLHYILRFPESTASQMIEEMYSEIMSGYSLSEILNSAGLTLSQETNLKGICEIWEVTASLMLELELPMLKGRSRNRYAEEKDISPWEIGMVDGEETHDSSKERHMYEFPVEIQEAMYQAGVFANEQAMDVLGQYKTKEKIQSEEYIYLLAYAHVISARYERAEKLIQSLSKSSVRGKEAAKTLQKMLEEGMDVMDEWDEYPADFPEAASWIPPQPYVREMPKIGRNDPCPCGSGKKYKRCCGKNL